MHTNNINKDFFLKGFFSWFGVEDLPLRKEVEDSISTSPNKAIKEDLKRVKTNYRKSLNQLKKEAYTLG